MFADNDKRQELNSKIDFNFADYLNLANIKYYNDTSFFFHSIKQLIKKLIRR